jgi:tRNA (cmo5U34)-methyltransferase
VAYRWNISDFATGYDAAADIIHPCYLEIQDTILRLLPLGDAPAIVVDLGGGSGRLMVRLLERWPQAHGIVVDQSEAFLGIAERRLAQFGERATCVLSRLQDAWLNELSVPVNAFVSMSAIHHLEPAEKQTLYGRCFEMLAPGGALINGDEIRPRADDDYLGRLKEWADHMQRIMARGTIPVAFHSALQGWIDRNVTRFGQPKKSGDDCHETIEAQLAYFREAGFAIVDAPWQRDLWAILRGVK